MQFILFLPWMHRGWKKNTLYPDRVPRGEEQSAAEGWKITQKRRKSTGGLALFLPLSLSSSLSTPFSLRLSGDRSVIYTLHLRRRNSIMENPSHVSMYIFFSTNANSLARKNSELTFLPFVWSIFPPPETETVSFVWHCQSVGWGNFKLGKNNNSFSHQISWTPF